MPRKKTIQHRIGYFLGPELKRAFAKHKTETEGHVTRLEMVFAAIDKKPQGAVFSAARLRLVFDSIRRARERRGKL